MSISVNRIDKTEGNLHQSDNVALGGHHKLTNAVTKLNQTQANFLLSTEPEQMMKG